MSSFSSFAFYAILLFDVIVAVSVLSYAIGYAWSTYDEWRTSRWVLVAEGRFKTMTSGVRQFVLLEDGRKFLLVLAHIELDLEPGERVRVLLGHCKRHVVQRAA